tara:strand:+ start:717 stop:1112 length:396 start_codon:yes stop_codon:yes gene_type:complete
MSSILKVNTLTGVSTAGSIVVTGEGNSTTTNLQQGLVKAFVHGDISANVVASQSFNIGTGTDHAAGKYSFVITSPMASADYIGLASSNNNNPRNATHHATNNTASALAICVDDAGTFSDAPYNACSLGDLA